MFDTEDTAFSYEREFIVWSFLQDFCEGKGGSNARTFLCRAALPSGVFEPAVVVRCK